MYLKLDFQLFGTSQKMGLRQVEQGVSSFFCHFEKSSNMPKLWQSLKPKRFTERDFIQKLEKAQKNA